MSRRLAALTCGVVVLPLLATSTLAAEAAPRPPQKPSAGERSVVSESRSSARVVRKTTARRTVAGGAAMTPFESRITAASVPVKDSAGRVWGPRPVTFGTWNRSSNLVGTDIKGTDDDVLYQRTGRGIKWYRLKVPARGAYQVRLLMAENYFDAPGKRVFDVKAEGRTVASKIDIVRAVGKGAAHDVTFKTEVVDGQLDLDFVAAKDNPLVSAIEVTSLKPMPERPESTAQPLVPLSPKSFYNADISTAPLAPNSAAIAARLASEVRDHYNGVAALNAYQYNASVVRADAKTPKVRVGFWDCQKKGYTPANLFDGRKQFVDVPIPASAVPARGNDGELSVYDPTSDKLWEFWRMRKSADGSWSACWGGRLDDVSTSQGIFPRPYGVSAAGLAMAPGVISLEDFRHGRIDHAMYLAVISPARWNTYSWPANRSDGNSTHPDAIMEGQRLRLDPSLDVSTLGLTPVGEMVARAAQTHGFVVADKAGAVAVITESGVTQHATTGTDPWNTLLAGPTYKALENFPWEKMQVLPADYGRP